MLSKTNTQLKVRYDNIFNVFGFFVVNLFIKFECFCRVLKLIFNASSFVLQDDLTKTVNTSRWEIIQNALLQDITSSRALEQAILEYNHKCAEDGEFSTLHTLFEQVSLFLGEICTKIAIQVKIHQFGDNIISIFDLIKQ